MSVAGRTVLITGANRGLGAALVTSALARNAATVYAGARDPSTISQSDPRVHSLALDLTQPAQIDAAAKQLPDVDLLVCNAGITCIMPAIATLDETAFRETFEVNFFGTMHLVRAFAQTLRQREGGIIFVLSSAAIALSRSAPIYSASKAATLMFALGVREELKADGVTVTVSLPGFIKTDMSVNMTSPKASAQQVADRTLDGWAAGDHTVWPDRFAEMVSYQVGESMLQVLDEPGVTMTRIVTAFGTDPAAGN